MASERDDSLQSISVRLDGKIIRIGALYGTILYYKPLFSVDLVVSELLDEEIRLKSSVGKGILSTPPIFLLVVPSRPLSNN
ncbi:unnamed protein product, partial [Vitis vinifera]|uniref:Uncharacterized protein n=1 Tax=Vitis vinifera TaxID=29760 RepID=D7T7X6_VITVI